MTAAGIGGDAALHHEVSRFLFAEAELLDAWRLEEWLGLLGEDAVYEVPPLGRESADPSSSLFLIHDDRARLEARVRQLLGKQAWAENPRSTTRRIVANIVAAPAEEPSGERDVEVRSNFLVSQIRHDRHLLFSGRYRHRLTRADGRWRIRRRTVLLDHDSMFEHRSISFLL